MEERRSQDPLHGAELSPSGLREATQPATVDADWVELVNGLEWSFASQTERLSFQLSRRVCVFTTVVFRSVKALSLSASFAEQAATRLDHVAKRLNRRVSPGVRQRPAVASAAAGRQRSIAEIGNGSAGRRRPASHRLRIEKPAASTPTIPKFNRRSSADCTTISPPRYDATPPAIC